MLITEVALHFNSSHQLLASITFLIQLKPLTLKGNAVISHHDMFICIYPLKLFLAMDIIISGILSMNVYHYA